MSLYTVQYKVHEGKRECNMSVFTIYVVQVDLFSKLTTKDKDDSDMEGGSSSDSTDSEESEYSGLEEEEDDSSEPESFEVVII